MSISSLTSPSQSGTIYLSDASEQLWTPDTNSQNPRPVAALQWPDAPYENINMVNCSAPTYGVQKPTTEHPNYFQHHNNFSQPNREYVDLTYQKRDFINNGQYIANTSNANMPNVTFTSANIERHGPVYTNTYPNIPRTEPPYANNVWTNGATNGTHTSRNNWSMNKVTNSSIKKPKRVRTAFTTNQMMELEVEYGRSRYLDRNRRIELSERLQLSEKTIKVWFQNRRMKDKKNQAEGVEELEATSTTETLPEMNLPPPYYYHQSVHNKAYQQGNSMPMERYQVSAPRLDPSAISIPIQNAVVNAYPNFFTPSNVTQCANPNSQQKPSQPQFQNIVMTEEIDNVSSEINDDDTESNTEDILGADDIKKEELSSELDDTSKSDGLQACVSGDNWDLSWVRIMNMNDEF